MSFSNSLKRLYAAAGERQRGISDTHRLVRLDDLQALLEQFHILDSQYRLSLSGLLQDPKALSMTVSALSETHPNDKSGFYSLARAMNAYLYDDKVLAYDHLETAIKEHGEFRKLGSIKHLSDGEGLGVDLVGGVRPNPLVNPGPRNFKCCTHCQKPMQRRYWLFGEYYCDNYFCKSNHLYIPERPMPAVKPPVSTVNPPGDD